MDSHSTFIVTGAAGGIGKHLVDRLVARGFRIMATDVRFDALEAVADQAGWPFEQVRLRRLDVCKPHEWQALVDNTLHTFERLDVLVNLAGYLDAGRVDTSSIDDVYLHVDVNLKGTIFGTQVAARHMVQQGRGHIINMASIAGLGPIPGFALYSAAKSGVRAFSLAAAYELRPNGVAVTVVCPDAVHTEMLQRQAGNPQAALMFSGRRTLEVEEVGDVLLGRVLEKRPLEVRLPRGRCWLALLGNLFPRLLFVLSPWFWRRGVIRQRTL